MYLFLLFRIMHLSFFFLKILSLSPICYNNSIDFQFITCIHNKQKKKKKNHKYISIIQSSKITIRIKQHADSQWNNGNFLKKSSKEKHSIIHITIEEVCHFLKCWLMGLSLDGFVLFKCGLAWSILRLGLVSGSGFLPCV